MSKVTMYFDKKEIAIGEMINYYISCSKCGKKIEEYEKHICHIDDYKKFKNLLGEVR